MLRYTMVLSFLDALRTATTKKNCASAFRKSGIYPLDKSMPLNSTFTVDHAPDHVRERRHGSSGVLTEMEVLDIIFQEEYHREISEEDADVDILYFMKKFMVCHKRYGRFISNIGPIFVEEEITMSAKDNSSSRVSIIKKTSTINKVLLIFN